MKNSNVYPVIDLFAGPGGLGEGFASIRQLKNRHNYAFRTAISIEKDLHAHKTLQLRHFYRAFAPDAVPDDYYDYLESKISLEELYLLHPEEASQAQQTAWWCTLGEESHDNVKKRISRAIGSQKKWILVGGPPCQAYSSVGRSRMRGNPEFESDPRHFLYKEYLRILADHQPPLFVMENVRGLISSKINGVFVIKDILRDLSKPECALVGSDSGLEYSLYSLSESGNKNTDPDPNSFIVKSEEYGIPQARHRIFILGIRKDIKLCPEILERSTAYTVRDVIGDMPLLRSSISKSTDSDDLWVQTLRDIVHQSWFVKGRENGLAEFTTLAQQSLTTLNHREFKTSDRTYSVPKELTEWLLDDRLKVLMSHESRAHMQSDLHRYFFAAVYAQIKRVTPKLRHFPDELLPNHKNVELGRTGLVFPDRFRVQTPDSPSTTITSHISKDGHYFIHYDPTQCRSLTVREVARLQTFPDNYKFEGNRTEQYRQVGNAVSPLLLN